MAVNNNTQRDADKSFIAYSRPTIRKEELRYTLECMISDQIAPGKLVSQFEEELKDLLQVPSLKTTSSATMAFFLILKLLDVKKGDEIILPSFLPQVLLNPIYYLEAVPVIVDVDINDYSPLLNSVKAKISSKTKALMLAHLFGIPIDISKYKELDIPIIENCSQALGAKWLDKPCGSLADFSFFSFYENKMISTGGSGGALASINPEIQEKAEALLKENPKSTEFKLYYPFPMNDLQASMGLSQLSQLDDFISSRRKIAAFYDQALKKIKKEPLHQFKDREIIRYNYLLKPNLAVEEALNFFHQYNIEAKKPIELPLHRILNLSAQEYANTESILRETISLPIYPTLKKSEAELIKKIAVKV